MPRKISADVLTWRAEDRALRRVNDPRPRLGEHPNGRGPRPSIEQVRHFVRPATREPGFDRPETEHHVLRPYRGRRWLHPRSGQALIKLDGQVWNAVRLLIEHEDYEGQAYVNSCGRPECVRLDHWLPTKPAPLANAIRSFDGVWRLWLKGAPVKKDCTVIGGVPSENVRHVIRVLVDPHAVEHRFITACGVAYDPALLVLTKKHEANCEACIR